MEFPFQTTQILQCDDIGFSIIDGKQPQKYRRNGGYSAQRSSQNFMLGGNKSNLSTEEQLDQIIDQMGVASAKAQRLPNTITTSGKLFSSDNRLYLRANGKQVIGLLKVGHRNLFIRDERANIKEIKPLCVLDFYVHESIQRGGQGRALFDYMLQHENITPNKLAYDRPSEKLIKFLGKHYGLHKYVPQNNNFVVFDAYWNSSENNSQNMAANYSQQIKLDTNKQEIQYNQQNEKFSQSGQRGNSYSNYSQSNGQNHFGTNQNTFDNRYKRQDIQLGPRKLSNTGLEIVQQSSNDTQAKKTVKFSNFEEPNQYKIKNENQYQKHNDFANSISDQSSFRQAYIDAMRDQQNFNKQNIEIKGKNKGFSNDRVSNLLNFGEIGPLDTAGNDKSKKDVLGLRMENVNYKINNFDNEIKKREQQLIELNQQALQKQAAATASMVSGFYRGPGGSQNTQPFQKATIMSQSAYSTNSMDSKAAMNNLYNKRNQQEFNQKLLGENQQAYLQRKEHDRQMVGMQKKMGESGVPWGNNNVGQFKTTNSIIGSYYQ